MIDLWHEAMNHIFSYCYFKYNKVLYLLKNTQIQGSKSGGENCNLYLVVHEIKHSYWFQKLVKIILRYKDDIFFIPKTGLKVKTVAESNKIISKLYPGFQFESEIGKTANICDITVNINYNILKLSTTTLRNANKITS